MGQFDHQPDSTESPTTANADSVLDSITRDLRSLQQELVVQITQDIGRLQHEKLRLQQEVEQLQSQYQRLQAQQQTELSQQQLAQQQVWAKQLAQALAVHIQKLLTQQMVSNPGVQQMTDMSAYLGKGAPSPEGYPLQTYQVLSSLDQTVSATLQSLEKDLGSYQSSLSQQLQRMHSMEKQGEAILDALVERLSGQLQQELARSRAASPAVSAPAEQNGGLFRSDPVLPREASPRFVAATPAPTPAPIRSGLPPQAARSPRPAAPQSSQGSGLSTFQAGIIFILLSTFVLSFHNVVVSMVGGFASTLFGVFPIESQLDITKIPNSILLLWLRMVVVVPLMAIAASQLYPKTWQDIRRLFESGDSKSWVPVLGSGLFLCLSQFSIYTAISQVGPGVAVTILFMYPLVTVPLAWVLFGDRPSWLRNVVMVTILAGVILTAWPKLNLAAAGMQAGVGVAIAAFSGVCFAFYLIFMQLSFKRMHPIPVSFLQFSTILALTSVTLIFFDVTHWLFNSPLYTEVDPAKRGGVFMYGLVLGILTLFGYLFNNYGVRYMGAGRASILASSGPVVTALLAMLMINSQLQAVQWVGIIVVTLSVAALSLEKLLITNKTVKPKS